MEQTILTKGQACVLNLVRANSDLALNFYLSGGTALAEYYLKHRYSDDLDFFTDHADFPWQTLDNFIQNIKHELGYNEIVYQKVFDRRIFFLHKNNEVLKVEFTYYPFKHLDEFTSIDGLLVDSLKDIAANKFMVLTERFESKDFVDIYFLIKDLQLDIKNISALVLEKFGVKLDPTMLGSELARVKNLLELPRLIKPVTIDEIKDLFGKEMLKLTKEIFK